MSGAAWALEVRGLSAQGFELAGATCRGAARAVNEDRVRVCERGLCVIDGVGGLGTGEVFAELAANRVQRLLVRGKGPDWALREASCDLAELRRYVLREGGGAMGCACEIGPGGRAGLPRGRGRCRGGLRRCPRCKRLPWRRPGRSAHLSSCREAPELESPSYMFGRALAFCDGARPC